jgi:hypothetical protein
MGVVGNLSRLDALIITENINMIEKTLTQKSAIIVILMNQQFFNHMVNSVWNAGRS